MSQTTAQSTRARKFGSFMDGRLPQPMHVRRWDGAARQTSDWDNLRRDPELWYRGGNCLIRLYGKGQSRRGPAFKIPFSMLLAAKCHPLVERFLSRGGIDPPGSDEGDYEEFDRWNERNPARKVELYMPAPAGADRNQAFRYHLATRNFFAWLCRRSMVGDHLGGALVGLMNSMHEFRCDGEDNVNDLLDYVEEEGYLDMRNQPSHALALLHFAEAFHLKPLYINAFAHCAGMSEHLMLTSEYQYTSSVSKKLIRRSKVELDLRLGHSSEMLRTFLEDELSETHLGLSPGARAHLERFRSFLLSFYATKFGYYPPPSIDARTRIFSKETYDVLVEDFECLYELLVDESFTCAENSPFLAQGGICTVQSVHSFDLRCHYKSLKHPLPLLPELASPGASKRLSWLAKADKLKPGRQLLSHAALAKASNNSKSRATRNDLVQAYRRFEEDTIASPKRIDRKEKLSLVDARKVRWILIYAVYQVLRHAAETPAEVGSCEGVSYHVAVSTAHIPPWRQSRDIPSLVRRQTDMAVDPYGSVLEIKPDIDYLNLTHRQTPNPRPLSFMQGPPTIPPRSRSLTRGFSRNEVFRRSLGLFRPSPAPATAVAQPPAKSSYHEIVVHGYGNGTNAVKFDSKIDEVHSETRSPSASSNSSTKSGSESGSSAATADTSAPATSPKAQFSPAAAWDSSTQSHILSPTPIRGRRREIVSLLPTAFTSQRTFSPLTRPQSAAYPSKTAASPAPPEPDYAYGYSVIIEQQQEEMSRAELQPSPLRIRKDSSGSGNLVGASDPGSWEPLPVDDDIKPEWEQYAGLGGHTPIEPATA